MVWISKETLIKNKKKHTSIIPCKISEKKQYELNKHLGNERADENGDNVDNWDLIAYKFIKISPKLPPAVVKLILRDNILVVVIILTIVQQLEACVC